MNAPTIRFAKAALTMLALTAPVLKAQDLPPANDLKIMTWNIWHGGREDGEQVGPARIAEILKKSGADLIAMQETYGSGQILAEALGFHLHARGTNVSIHSRYPIVEDISVHKEFECVGALIELPNDTRLAFYSIWLPYSAEIWAVGTRDTNKPESMLAACQASHASLQAIWRGIENRLSAKKYKGLPIVIAGDFNSMSHLDYGGVGWDQFDAVVDWPTSHVLTKQGFVDSYRACNPPIDRVQDSTWTPRFPEQEQDRIDFIFYRAVNWHAVDSRVLRNHALRFPSDHAAVLTTLRERPATAATKQSEAAMRVVSYNIKHGAGMDNRVDLDRTAAVLAKLRPDFVGLQEVDLGTTRSKQRNQANELARSLDMHPSFGSFMDYQGGRYGLAILSKHAIVKTTSLRLPDGHEPRVALIVEARLPNGETVLVINVHFDWVADDKLRFAQASVLAAYLQQQTKPYILLGDFNDVPGSRTLALFDGLAHRTKKPKGNHMTFSSTKPNKEIDFIFCAPAKSWQIHGVEVIDEPMASDHRPITADLALRRR